MTDTYNLPMNMKRISAIGSLMPDLLEALGLQSRPAYNVGVSVQPEPVLQTHCITAELPPDEDGTERTLRLMAKVETGSLESAWSMDYIRCAAKPAPTFAAIIRHLSEQKPIRERFTFDGVHAGIATFTEGCTTFRINSDGLFTARSNENGIVLFTAEQMHLITRACQQIAALRQ